MGWGRRVKSVEAVKAAQQQGKEDAGEAEQKGAVREQEPNNEAQAAKAP